MYARPFRLRKHADYQRVYKASRKQFAKQMTWFSTLRTPQPGEDTTPRVGLTVGKVMGKAVDRNRIKRRMREVIRKNLHLLTAPVDVILHPRRTVLELELPLIDREIAQIFRQIQRNAEKPQPTPPKDLTS